jgi:hypothetical protein
LPRTSPEFRVELKGGIAVALSPRFYFARVSGGFVLHAWRFWLACETSIKP